MELLEMCLEDTTVNEVGLNMTFLDLSTWPTSSTSIAFPKPSFQQLWAILSSPACPHLQALSDPALSDQVHCLGNFYLSFKTQLKHRVLLRGHSWPPAPTRGIVDALSVFPKDPMQVSGIGLITCRVIKSILWNWSRAPWKQKLHHIYFLFPAYFIFCVNKWMTLSWNKWRFPEGFWNMNVAWSL